MTPQLSIVIPVYNNWWLTARVLRALDDLRGSSLSFETIVVDNASSDETAASIEDFSWVDYVRMERNANFGGACNAGARRAHAPLVFFLNNDAYPLGDALTPLVRAFDDPSVTVAGAALFFEDGVTQCAGFVVLANAHWHYSCRNLPAGLEGVTRSRCALAVSGAAMAVRTQSFLDEGGFDDSYVNGFEDVDFCMRVRARGGEIRYVAESRFAHYEAASSGRYAHEAENEATFYRRWATRFATIPRTARGEVGAISVHRSAGGATLENACLEDLEASLHAFGHPLVRGNVRAWQRVDPRYRRSASLQWFTSADASPGVVVEGRPGKLARMSTRGAVELSVPWLPCASGESVAGLPVELSLDPTCSTLAVAGFEAAPAARKREVVAALAGIVGRTPAARIVSVEGPSGKTELAEHFADRVDAAPLLTSGTRLRVAIAGVLHAGLTDDCAFGTVVLAQAGLPAVVYGNELDDLFASDVALVGTAATLKENVHRLIDRPDDRARYASLLAADARRRFSPRRTAIRVVDLLCAARFGLQRPTPARSNSPLAR